MAGCWRVADGDGTGGHRAGRRNGAAAIGLTASLDALAGTPEHFGVPWDLSASTAIGNPDELAPSPS